MRALKYTNSFSIILARYILFARYLDTCLEMGSERQNHNINTNREIEKKVLEDEQVQNYIAS